MIIITYKEKEYKCEITRRDINAVRVRVYDENNVGNLYIWTREYKERGEGPKPWTGKNGIGGNKSKLIPKGAVYEAFNRLLRPDSKPQVIEEERVRSAAALTVLPEPVEETKPEVKTRTRKAKPKADRFAD